MLALVAVLAALGFAYEAVAIGLDERTYPPPGQMVDVGGLRLHILCMGSGSPTVVLESSLPAGSAVWTRVQSGMAGTTRVCAYDRAGEGWSDLGPEPRDALRVTAELHELLARSQVSDVVLVGHSFGGLYTRVFAGRHPEQVKGMVLIDVSHPDQWARTESGAQVQRVNQVSAEVAPWLARLGILRLSGYFKIDPDLPPRQQDEFRSFVNGVRIWDSDRAVFRAIDATMAQTRASGSLGSRPLIVLTATSHGFRPEEEALHRELQDELPALSSNTRHLVVEGATHTSLVHNAEQSRITVAAISDVVDAVRSGRPLN